MQVTKLPRETTLNSRRRLPRSTPIASPPASNRDVLLDQLDEEILASAKRMATNPEHRRRIQKKLV